MTGSQPVRPVTSVGADASDVPRSARARAIDFAGKVTLHTISGMPNRLKRLLAGARPITIDGNTLDTTMQLMLAASRLSGSEGLILSENVAKARTELNAVAAQFPRVKVDVTRTDLAVAGPGGRTQSGTTSCSSAAVSDCPRPATPFRFSPAPG